MRMRRAFELMAVYWGRDIVDDDDDDDADSLHCSHHARLIVLLFYFLFLWEGCFFLLLTFVC